MEGSVKFHKGDLVWCTWNGKRLSIVMSELYIEYDTYDIILEGIDMIHEVHKSWLVKTTN